MVFVCETRVVLGGAMNTMSTHSFASTGSRTRRTVHAGGHTERRKQPRRRQASVVDTPAVASAASVLFGLAGGALAVVPIRWLRASLPRVHLAGDGCHDCWVRVLLASAVSLLLRACSRLECKCTWLASSDAA